MRDFEYEGLLRLSNLGHIWIHVGLSMGGYPSRDNLASFLGQSVGIMLAKVNRAWIDRL